MGSAKTEAFTQEENEVAKYAKALGHPARIAIIQYLIKKQSCICGDIVNELPLSQATVSQHLKELKTSGIIKGEIEGVKTCYCIDPEVWKKVQGKFNSIFDAFKPINCC
ncbi:metalloregulator ArsR/SmtB family transcription factor [Reichenbachiella sp. MALMAid0571]|uniref:ArsR/SmtB family transcription factor n=1 Tax=Reichenbachiella sp. MALMAid0571 TaxID=3143939 RepID=UPI0032DF8735